MNELSRYWFPPLIPLWLTPRRVGVRGWPWQSTVRSVERGMWGLLLEFCQRWIFYAQSLNRIRLFAAPWTVAHQAPLSMGFTRLLCPWDSPGKSTGVGWISYSRDLPDPVIKLSSLASPALTGGFLGTGTTWEGLSKYTSHITFSIFHSSHSRLAVVILFFMIIHSLLLLT